MSQSGKHPFLTQAQRHTPESSPGSPAPTPMMVPPAAIMVQPTVTQAEAAPATKRVRKVTPAEAGSEKPHFHGHRKRLRDRFLTSGSAALADYELLEMVLFSARPQGDVKPLAKKLLARFGSFAGVMNAEAAELAGIDGVGEAAVGAIKVVRAAAERLLQIEATAQPILQSWDALLNYCTVAMAHAKIEEFRLLFLNHRNMLIRDEVQQRGTVNHTPVYPREVVKRALELGASALILLHNHPSGSPEPSQADIDITRKIQQACAAVGIKVHDHVVIGGQDHFSMRAHGLISD